MTPADKAMIDQDSALGLSQSELSFGGSALAARSSSTIAGTVPMTLCLLAALTPLIFAARLFDPFIAPKEILVHAGTATAASMSSLSLGSPF